MKTKTNILVLFLLILPFLLMAQGIEEFKGKQYFLINNEWKVYNEFDQQFYPIVQASITLKYVQNTDEITIQNFATQHGLTYLRKAITGWYDYNLASNDLFTKVNVLLNSSIVENVEIPTYGEFIGIPDDSGYSFQWHLYQSNGVDIDIENAWDIETGNPNIVVAILDTGTDWIHEDLGLGNDSYQNIYTNPLENDWTNPNDPTTGNGIDDDGNGFIDDWKGWNFHAVSNDSRSLYWHGTQVAGIVAAKSNNNRGVAGVAGGWNDEGVNLLICQVGTVAPNALVLDDAIMYAAELGVKVIQLSLFVPPSNAIDDAIETAYTNYGVLIVCSSGNNFEHEDVYYPASNPNVLAAGATNQIDEKWYYSTFGENMFIAAPGKDISSTQLNNSYGRESGTSFASPIVSAVIALMYSQNECLNKEQVIEILKNTADKVGDYIYDWDSERPGHSKELGYGRVNAFKAVQMAQNMYSSTIDLYMRDTDYDLGYDDPPSYPFTWDYDDGPDVWVRNQDDGLTNQEHENPEYDENEPVFVYVRVGNKSCVPSLGSEKLSLYWTLASTSNGMATKF